MNGMCWVPGKYHHAVSLSASPRLQPVKRQRRQRRAQPLERAIRQAVRHPLLRAELAVARVPEEALARVLSRTEVAAGRVKIAVILADVAQVALSRARTLLKIVQNLS